MLVQHILVLYILAGGLGYSLAILLMTRSQMAGAKLAGLAMLMIAATASLASLNLTDPDLESKHLWYLGEMLCLIGLVLAYVGFVLSYSGLTRWLRGWRFALLMAVPCISIAGIVTDPFFHLYNSSYFIFNYEGVDLLATDSGPIVWLWRMFDFPILTLASVILLKHVVKGDKLGMGGATLLIVSVLLPMSVSIMSVYWPLLSYLNMTLLCLSFTGLFLYMMMFRYGVSEIIPVAKENIFNNMDDACILVDSVGRIAEMNSATIEVLPRMTESSMGSNFKEVFQAYPELVQLIRSPLPVARTELALSSGQYVSVLVKDVNYSHWAKDGRMIIVSDMTERRRMEEDLRQTKMQLEMMSRLSRHDIANNITAIHGFASSIERSATDERTAEYSHRIKQASENVQAITKITKDYLDGDGARRHWQKVGTIIGNATGSVDMQAIGMGLDTGEVEIFADGMFERVISTIIENSVRHGEKVSAISVRCHANGEMLHIEIADDGIGVPLTDKTRIFENGFGKNTGYGLYYSKEILDMNGFGIVEKGEPGKGALFDITVPQNRYRNAG